MQSFWEFAANKASTTKRSRFLNYWRSLRNNSPLFVDPIPKEHQGTTRGEDILRITGSPEFIFSVIARLKDLLMYENDNTKLEFTYQQSQYTKSNGEPSYTLYINVRQR